MVNTRRRYTYTWYLVYDTDVVGFGRIREVATLLVLGESAHDIAPNATEYSSKHALSY